MKYFLPLIMTCLAFPALAEKVTTGTGGILRGLDKVDGSLSDIELRNGQSQDFGRLNILLTECRYPNGNLSGNAYAHLVIRDNGADQPIFNGWMIAATPALNALDHARYDVWVLRCKTQ